MLAKTETTLTEAVERWLAHFERALAEADRALLSRLFHRDSYWRDLLALTWDIRTVGGAEAIAGELQAHAAEPPRDSSSWPPAGRRRVGSTARAPRRSRRSSSSRPPWGDATASSA